MERLGSLDAVFLSIEHPTTPMNVGSLALFEGPPPSIGDVSAFVATKIATVPRCRQRVRLGWHNLLRPVWEDAPDFSIADHVHHHALAEGVTVEDLTARLMVPPLDRSRPLWEMWMVDGLADGGWALVSKMHHCMVDGVAGTDLLSRLLDTDPDAALAPIPPWVPAPALGAVARWRYRVAVSTASLWSHLRGLVHALVDVRHTWARAEVLAAGAKAMWLQPRRHGSPLTGPIGDGRVWLHTRRSLADVAAVRGSLGGTVNDAVLTAIAHGFRALFLARGAPVEGCDVMTLMPVSTRSSAEHGLLDNRVAVTHVLLPVGIDDPVDTHAALRRQVAAVKASHMTDASTVLLHTGDLTPHALAARIARGVVRAQQNIETITTNVPGPQHPLYLCGRRMTEMYPVAPIAGLIRVAVAIWSYDGTLFFGVTADRDSVHDLPTFVAGIDHCFDRLLLAAT